MNESERERDRERERITYIKFEKHSALHTTHDSVGRNSGHI